MSTRFQTPVEVSNIKKHLQYELIWTLIFMCIKYVSGDDGTHENESLGDVSHCNFQPFMNKLYFF